MPRGRLAVGMVLMTSSVSPSTTVTVLSFSFETKICRANAGDAVIANRAAMAAIKLERFISGTFLLGSVGELALGFGFVVAERVVEILLVQEALLRGHGHEGAGAGDQHRLAQLMVPLAEGEPLPLETGDGERGRQDVGAQVGNGSLARAQRRLADSARGEPCGEVPLGHDALGEPLEPALHLHAGVLLVRAMPGDRAQALGADHGPRPVSYTHLTLP